MFNFFKNSSKSAGGNQGDEPLLDGRALCRVMRHFPVGTKVQYYPEYRKEILLESVVIGYAINDEIIYSTHNLSCDEKSGALGFEEQGKRKSYSQIKSFCIIVPVFTQSEARLDYVRREELLKIGGLVTGNTITLLAEQQGGQIPVLDTTVHKRAMFKEGYYANQTVALLEVNTESLMLIDQRAHLRLQTNIPAMLRLARRGEYKLLNCTMVDFSDISLRLVIDHDSIVNVEVKEADDVIVAFNLPGRSEQISLMGGIFRVEDDAVVVMLKGMVDKGQSARLGQIEILKIKANLLQHGQANIST
jgi:hypothetical protein